MPGNKKNHRKRKQAERRKAQGYKAPPRKKAPARQIDPMIGMAATSLLLGQILRGQYEKKD